MAFGVILVIDVLARQFALSKGLDHFNNTVAFFATVVVLMALYASLQITFNQLLLPCIEAFLFRFPAFQKMKDNYDPVSVPEALKVEDTNQVTLEVIKPALAAEKPTSEPSEYEVLRANVITEKNRATKTRLEKVLSYT